MRKAVLRLKKLEAGMWKREKTEYCVMKTED
jgi:hypothetical protein